MRPLLCALILASLFGLFGCGKSEASTGAKRVAVIPKGTTHVFWKGVEAGARKGGRETGLEIVWKGPLVENDRAQQIQLVQQFLGEGVAGIALAPLDHAALVPSVKAAKERGIPVVIYDSNLDGKPGEDFVSFIATDNHAGGKLGGERLAKILNGTGKVVMLRYSVGSASTEAREAGFLEAARAGGLEVIVDNRYAGATAGEAKDAALNLIDSLRQAQGVFCSNESSSYGMLLALEQMDLAGKIRFVGFDASPPLVAALRAGKIDALVVQNPRRMGEEAVKALAATLRGEKVQSVIDTGAVLATQENLSEPAVAALVE